MDRFYYYQKRTQERQREISQELATRQLLNDTEAKPLGVKRVVPNILRSVPAMIIIITLLLFYFSH
jgi:hypothetical protein